jgi:outer membrane assembly lipoprotein YfgL
VSRWLLTLSRLLTAGSVLALLSACSSTPDKPKPAELPALTAAASAYPLQSVWTNQIGPVLTPLNLSVHTGQVAVASSNGTVALLDASTGKDIWRVALNAPLQAGVGGDGTRFAVITQTNEVIALQAGQVIWRYRLNASTYTAPLVAGGRVFLLTADRTVVALDGASGQRLWQQQRSGDPLVLRQAGLLMAVEDTLVAGMAGRLVGLNPNNGSTRWEAVVGASRGTNEVERLVDIVTGVSREGHQVCVRSFQTAVTCVDATKGTVLWTRTANGHQGLAGNDQLLVGVESDSKVLSWSRALGQPVWNSDALRFRGLSEPMLRGASVVVGDENGWVHRLAVQDGQLQNRISTDGSGIALRPVSVAGVTVVVTRNGGVYGLRLD